MPSFGRMRGPGGQFVSRVSRVEIAASELERVLQGLSRGVSRVTSDIEAQPKAKLEDGTTASDTQAGGIGPMGLIDAGLKYGRKLYDAIQEVTDAFMELSADIQETSADIARARTVAEAQRNYEEAKDRQAQQRFEETYKQTHQRIADLFTRIVSGVDMAEQRQLKADLDVAFARMKLDEKIANQTIRKFTRTYRPSQAYSSILGQLQPAEI